MNAMSTHSHANSPQGKIRATKPSASSAAIDRTPHWPDRSSPAPNRGRTSWHRGSGPRAKSCGCRSHWAILPAEAAREDRRGHARSHSPTASPSRRSGSGSAECGRRKESTCPRRTTAVRSSATPAAARRWSTPPRLPSSRERSAVAFWRGAADDAASPLPEPRRRAPARCGRLGRRSAARRPARPPCIFSEHAVTVATGALLTVLLTMSMVKSSVVTLDEQSSFCITPWGEASATPRKGRVPKNTREFGSPMATCRRRCLRPCNDCRIRSMTFNNSLGGQGSMRETTSTAPSGVTATSLTEISCSPR